MALKKVGEISRLQPYHRWGWTFHLCIEIHFGFDDGSYEGHYHVEQISSSIMSNPRFMVSEGSELEEELLEALGACKAFDNWLDDIYTQVAADGEIIDDELWEAKLDYEDSTRDTQ